MFTTTKIGVTPYSDVVLAKTTQHLGVIGDTKHCNKNADVNQSGLVLKISSKFMTFHDAQQFVGKDGPTLEIEILIQHWIIAPFIGPMLNILNFRHPGWSFPLETAQAETLSGNWKVTDYLPPAAASAVEAMYSVVEP